MSTEDQGKNEAERTNAAVGNALCDGGALPWQYVEPFPDFAWDKIVDPPFMAWYKMDAPPPLQ